VNCRPKKAVEVRAPDLRNFHALALMMCTSPSVWRSCKVAQSKSYES
jgi:hypothetical protein